MGTFDELMNIKFDINAVAESGNDTLNDCRKVNNTDEDICTQTMVIMKKKQIILFIKYIEMSKSTVF